MADKKISQLDDGTDLLGTEILPMVQSSSTKKVDVDKLSVFTLDKTGTLADSQALAGTESFHIRQSQASEVEGEDPTTVNVKTSVKAVSDFAFTKSVTGQAKTAELDQAVDLDCEDYDETRILKLSWTGDAGIAVYTLPSASGHPNRLIRFISDSTFTTNTKVRLTPLSGENLDGSSDYYEINKAYEGVAIWSDGTEWFIIQKKA